MGRKSNIDWAQGRILYTQQGKTMSQVAISLQVTTRAVQRHAAAEDWGAARKHFGVTTNVLADAMGAEQVASQITENTVAREEALTDALPLMRTAVIASLDLINAKLELDKKNLETVSLKNVVALLSAVGSILEGLTTPGTSTETNTTNILVQLQALGASGRVAVYRQLSE